MSNWLSCVTEVTSASHIFYLLLAELSLPSTCLSLTSSGRTLFALASLHVSSDVSFFTNKTLTDIKKWELGEVGGDNLPRTAYSNMNTWLLF